MAKNLLKWLTEFIRDEVSEYFDSSEAPVQATRTGSGFDLLLTEARERLGGVTASLYRTELAITECNMKLEELGGGVHEVIERGREDLAMAVLEERQSLEAHLADLRAELLELKDQQAAYTEILREFSPDSGLADADAEQRAAKLKEFLELVRKDQSGEGRD